MLAANRADMRFTLPHNFAKFIEDCCDLDGLSKLPFADIKGRYRIWSMSSATSNVHVKQLKTYLADHFVSTKMYVPEMFGVFECFVGLRIKPMLPFPIVITDSSTDIERFVYEKTEVSIAGHVLMLDFANRFMMWKGNGQVYDISDDELSSINTFMFDNFISAKFNTGLGEGDELGFYGICFKGERPFSNIIRKAVVKIDVATNQVVATYESIAHAAHENGMTCSNMSHKMNRPLNGLLYRYEL